MMRTKREAAAFAPLKFTVEKFDQMGDMEWFEGRRPVLIDGTILEQGPRNPPHANGVSIGPAAGPSIGTEPFGTRSPRPASPL